MANQPDDSQMPPGVGDELDAKYRSSIYIGVVGSSSSGGSKPSGSTSEGSEFTFSYNMNYNKRGMFVIINNKVFDAHSSTQRHERKGTDEDAGNLYLRFKQLGFDVYTYHNVTCKDMLKILIEAAKLDHSDSDCFGCAILSHGDEGVVLGTDGILHVESLIAPFKGDRCLSLAGKPKFFIIQACRGDQLDHGVDVCDALGDLERPTCIPTEADTLLAYSTTPGYLSWRNVAKGSWFIQALCRVLERWGEEKELLWMLTHTNYLVSHDYESNNEFINRKKQIPSIVSQLTKELYFRPKT